MLYTPTTKRALELCAQAHEGQRDKSGMPYVLHPFHLAEQMTTPSETCVALLHDTMEDCGLTEDDLRAAGMGDDVVEAVRLLTHERGVPYLDYVRTISKNPLARAVKVADLRHNSDLGRLDVVTDADRRRVRKYQEARVILGDMTYELMTLAGPFRVEVNDEARPLAVRGDVLADSVQAESRKGSPANLSKQENCEKTTANTAPPFSDPHGSYVAELDVLPLVAGDVVRAVYDFGSPAVRDGGGGGRGLRFERSVCGETYFLDLKIEDDGMCDPSGETLRHPLHMLDPRGAFEVVANPMDCLDSTCVRHVQFRIAWKALA